MAQHAIPEQEKELHEESQDCICEPEFVLDDESGEMVWKHHMLDPGRLFDNFIVLFKKWKKRFLHMNQQKKSLRKLI